MWIEIGELIDIMIGSELSHPSRVCGLKCDAQTYTSMSIYVTPFTGVWIEILMGILAVKRIGSVTPFTGVWIEIILTPLS